MSTVSVLIAMEIYDAWASARGINEEEKDKNKDILRMAAMLHDVGKVGISDIILKKPGNSMMMNIGS